MINEKNPIFLKEELEAELKFSRFAFISHFALYFLLILFDAKFNFLLIVGTILFSLSRYFVIKLDSLKKIRIVNTFGTLVLIYLFCNLFLFDVRNSLTGNHLNDIIYLNIILNFIIIHESNRTFKFSALIAGIVSFCFFYIHELSYIYKTNVTPDNILIFMPIICFSISASYGSYLIFSKRKMLFFYSELLKEKNLMNKDMNLARNVQESLFPKIESIKGIKFSVFRKTTNLIGGDFYDFILLREGDIGIFITDVAGHGYSSAMVASMIKVLVSTIPYQLKLQPASLLNYLDEKISGEYKSHHASACYLYLNFKRREITYSNGGHPYLLYSKKGKDFETVEINGTLIGLGLKNIVLEEKKFIFEAGDRFFLYTDGLVENLNSRNNFLETEELVTLLNSLNHLDIATMKIELLTKIQKVFDDLEFTDDAMFLIFEFED